MIWGRAFFAAMLLTAVTAAACDDDSGNNSADTTDEADMTDLDTGRTGAGDDSGETVLGDNQVTIPNKDIGDVDLSALPLGSGDVSTSAVQGQLWVCNQAQEAPLPNEADLPWVFDDLDTYDLTAEAFVEGDVDWPDASFDVTVDGDTRTLTTNDLPNDHTTGVFPVGADDPAIQYRPSQSSIVANDLSFELAAVPAEADTPSCVGGEVGVALSGVVIFNALDANNLDAVAEEVQDHCFGHPNDFGYHYHSVSPCIPDAGTGHSKLMGYAFDGFGIYGPRGEGGTVLTTADLDECHGHTHEITWDGEKAEMFHYHATWEYPYTVGCYRGTSTVTLAP
jgi:hypothetical protein